MSKSMSISQAATHFRVSSKTIRRWIQAGKIKAKKKDRHWHVYLSDRRAPRASNTTSAAEGRELQLAETPFKPPSLDSDAEGRERQLQSFEAAAPRTPATSASDLTLLKRGETYVLYPGRTRQQERHL